jgi:hypothetical protein
MVLFDTFAGGLTQTDWFNGLTGTVATGTIGLAYNQSCYTSNVSMRQSQKYQEKNYNLSWVSVAREDIRSMMNITVNRIANYTLVSTLVVGVAFSSLLGANFRADTPNFIIHAFWVSMCISIMHFSLSIMFAVKGQNNAFVNTMRLLTWECRPENPGSYDHDYMTQAQQFERDGLRSIFRLPGIMPSQSTKRDGEHEPPRGRGAKGVATAPGETVEEYLEQEGEDAGQRSAKSSGASRETTPRSQRSFKSAGASRDHHGKAPKGPKDTPKHPDSQQRLWGRAVWRR